MQDIILFLSQHPVLVFVTFLVIIGLLFVELIRMRRSGFYIDPQTTVQKINHENAVVIDVRPIEIYRMGHIIDALSIPSKELRVNFGKLEKFKKRPIILVCDTGEESRKLATLFYHKNYDTYSLAGGMFSWRKADMPLIKEQ
ncbi:MAG TPA: rhodanese-like domain-containing protein [Gammaproteobacteria bacterium]|nr:rhodanese-like domain-containing protein [Gammaproteobacteria bacterium]